MAVRLVFRHRVPFMRFWMRSIEWHWRTGLLIFVLAAATVADAGPSASFLLTPACPSPNQAIEVTLYPAGDVRMLYAPSATVVGNVITVRVSFSTVDIMLSVPATVTVQPLPVGSYTLNVGEDYPGSSVSLLTTTFSVQENPPVCSPAAIRLLSDSITEGAVGKPFASPVRVKVIDEFERPVPGIEVVFERMVDPQSGELSGSPVAALSSRSVKTDIDGVAGITASGTATGVAQYTASYTRGIAQHTVYFILVVRDVADGIVRPVVEYARYGGPPPLHYFITQSPEEMADLDGGRHLGWQRTGAVFLAYSRTVNAPPPAGALPVCRFHGRPGAGLDSHFFTASAAECEAVRVQWPYAWTLETPEAFWIMVPDPVSGRCASQTRPIHRFFNQRADVNHRYVSDETTRHFMLAETIRPRVAQGYGPDAVIMCAPS